MNELEGLEEVKEKILLPGDIVKSYERYKESFSSTSWNWDQTKFVFGITNENIPIFIGRYRDLYYGEPYAEIKFPGEPYRFIPIAYIGVEFEGRDNPLQDIKTHYLKTYKEFTELEWELMYSYYVDCVSEINKTVPIIYDKCLNYQQEIYEQYFDNIDEHLLDVGILEDGFIYNQRMYERGMLYKAAIGTDEHKKKIDKIISKNENLELNLD